VRGKGKTLLAAEIRDVDIGTRRKKVSMGSPFGKSRSGEEQKKSTVREKISTQLRCLR